MSHAELFADLVRNSDFFGLLCNLIPEFYVIFASELKCSLSFTPMKLRI